jgi:hypothetical protein
MASYVILGAGKFGRLALRRLSAQDRSGRFLLIDRRPQALAAARTSGVEGAKMLEGDVISYLTAHLAPGFPWDWLIPMVPVHVAYAWLLEGPLAQEWEPVPVPGGLGNLAPQSITGAHGELYLSQARHLCPDDCDEPPICPVTGRERQQPLFRKLAGSTCPGWSMLVVASRQLAPGVGGYSPQELVKLAETAAGAPGPLLVATACRCHGVVHGLRRKGVRPA